MGRFSQKAADLSYSGLLWQMFTALGRRET
jgi:hypothetical protein